jgi:hypothetical protein
MQFDEYLAAHGVRVAPLEDFPGYLVEVGLPEDWKPVEAAPGVRAWAWMADPQLEVFCANAVLTMHRLSVTIDPTEVFAMLCEQQLHMLAGSVEHSRSLTDAVDGPGILGVLETRIPSERGTLDSTSITRVLTNGGQTFIAQLTLTALPESRVDRLGIWVTVTTAERVDPGGGGPR